VPEPAGLRLRLPIRITKFCALGGAGLAVAIALAGCGGSGPAAPAHVSGSTHSTSTTTSPSRSTTSVTIAPETNTPGDIPDTTAYVPFSSTAGGYTFSHPEGWAQTAQGSTVTFTDKYNGVVVSVRPGTTAPTVADARVSEIPMLTSSQPAFALTSISPATLPAGSGVLIVYRRNSPPDPVTGRSVRQEVHRFLIFAGGHVVAMDLFGAVGADNVDPYAKMSQSLHVP
jgi:hypothetical protein